jgi:hypothetical protein
MGKVGTDNDVSKTEKIKTETQTTAAADGHEPEEGWNVVSAGRETI